MRRLQQPGPAPALRSTVATGTPHVMDYVLKPGMTLNQALTAPLVAAGMQGGSLIFAGAVLAPFHYMLPGPSDGPDHAAWFGGPHSPAAAARIVAANATFGWRAGAPFVHCHAVWRMADAAPDSAPMGGHIIPDRAIVAAPTRVRAFVTPDAAIHALPDAETNFTLFQPEETPGNGRLLLARLRPNQDITLAIEALCAARGIRNAQLRGSLGSLIGARFTDGRVVEDYATEVLVRNGQLRDGRALLDMSVVDMQGHAHTGLLMRGKNAICITFELALEATG